MDRTFVNLTEKPELTAAMRHHDRGLQQQAGSASHPGPGHIIPEPFDFDLDTVFEYGLQRLLNGIDAQRRALGHR